MGQRTQVLIIKENNKGVKDTTVWHIQFGFGRVMPLILIENIIQEYFKDTFKKDYDFLNTGFDSIPKMSRIDNGIPSEILKNANIDDFASIVRVFDYCDNNNGGMVLYIKENESPYLRSEIKVGFLLGEEDVYRKKDKAFSQWLNVAEYCKKNSGKDYSDPEFSTMMSKFCSYFEIKDIENTTTVEENLEAIKSLREKTLKVKVGDKVLPSYFLNQIIGYNNLRPIHILTNLYKPGRKDIMEYALDGQQLCKNNNGFKYDPMTGQEIDWNNIYYDISKVFDKLANKDKNYIKVYKRFLPCSD